MIIVVGDSWGVGEWDKFSNISGPGFGQLLMLTDQVTNLSFGNASNTQSLDRLEIFLSRYQVNHTDTIYWVVTCPTRCVDNNYLVNSHKGLNATIQDVLIASLNRASKLATTYNVTIRLIGGTIDLLGLPLYSGLENTVPSWGRLLNDSYCTNMIMPRLREWEDLGILLKKQRPELIDEWITLTNDISNKFKCWDQMKNTYFTTDGFHPDRNGHRVLRDFLYPEYKSRL